MENLQLDFAEGRIKELIDQNVDERTLRMYVCSNIDQIFDVAIIMRQEQNEEKKTYWDSLAEKIIISYPRLYKLLCVLRINKIYEKMVERKEKWEK